MSHLQLLQYSSKKDEIQSSEIKVEKSSQYVIKTFSSGVVIRFPVYSTDVKCYEETINNKKVHIIKGNNAEVLVVNDENIVVVGNNNDIYCIGEKDSIINKGFNNRIHNIEESLLKSQIKISGKIRKSSLDSRVNDSKSTIINISELRNVWNSVSAYFA
ncbi:MAG: hypothetical protein ACD_20C00186G0004 [uncultured bacterium]|nr:MAG: hypothetical protein ACD_20C00186G0004 [uncultured bacterium]HBH18133.1 hypothetical protein [Cyanobacteria bacterium UBA9579]